MNYQMYTGRATWFRNTCSLYDYSYVPSVILYPEVFQANFRHIRHRVCLALGKYATIEPFATLTVGRAPEMISWVKGMLPEMPTRLIAPSIDRQPFEYDDRPKKDLICYITRDHKHPEMARMLRERYGDKVVEIVDRSESEVGEILKDAKVFVWRGNDKESTPRPPKEALVAGCVVVGLKDDLADRYVTNFGVRCSSVDEVLDMAGEALRMPVPSREERSIIRDKKDEMRDWVDLAVSLKD